MLRRRRPRENLHHRRGLRGHARRLGLRRGARRRHHFFLKIICCCRELGSQGLCLMAGERFCWRSNAALSHLYWHHPHSGRMSGVVSSSHLYLTARLYHACTRRTCRLYYGRSSGQEDLFVPTTTDRHSTHTASNGRIGDRSVGLSGRRAVAPRSTISLV